MHDRTLLLIALSVSALGLALLLTAFIAIAPDERPLDDVPDGGMTLVRGTLERVTVRGEVTTLRVRTAADAVVFGDPPSMEEGACVVLRGKRSTYEGEPQLVVSRVERCEGNT